MDRGAGEHRDVGLAAQNEQFGVAGVEGDGATEILDRILNSMHRMTEMLEDNVRGVERIVAIVQALRAFARPEPDRVEATDVGAVCREVYELLGSQLRHRARVVLELAPVPIVELDPRKLTQVVINLLVSAAEAIPPGEPDHEIRLRLGARDGCLELVVSDSGRKLAADLVRAGKWEDAVKDNEKGWQFHDWLDYQQSAEEIERDRDHNRNRQREFRRKLREGKKKESE